MRIALVSSYYAPTPVGGAEVFLAGLARALVERGHVVEAFCTAPEAGDDTADGIVVHRRGNHNLYWIPEAGTPSAARRALWHLRDLHNPGAAADTAEAIRAFGPDVVHLHQVAGFSPALYGELRRRLGGVAIVHTLHDFWLACLRQTLLDGRGRLCEAPHGACRVHSRVALSAARVVDRFVSPSRFLADWYAARGLIEAGRVQIIRYGIPKPPDQAGARRGRAPDEPLRVLYLGQLVRHKGVTTLLRAAAQLDPRRVAIDVAGAGPLEAEVRACAAVRFLGRLDGPAKEEALLRSDLLVVPSEWHDNSPITIIEALHRGLGIVGTAMGGIPELVDPARNGCLVPPGDAEALAAALGRAAAEPELVAAWQAGSLRAAAEYGLAECALEHERLFQRLLERSPAPR